MFWTGVTQLTVALFETADPEVAWTTSVPLWLPVNVKVACPAAFVVAVAMVGLAPVTVNCTVAFAIAMSFGSLSVAVSDCVVPVTFGPAIAGARTSELNCVG